MFSLCSDQAPQRRVLPQDALLDEEGGTTTDNVNTVSFHTAGQTRLQTGTQAAHEVHMLTVLLSAFPMRTCS